MSFLMLYQIPLEFCPLCNNSPAIISGTPQFFIRHVNNAGGKWNCLWRLILRLTGRQGRCEGGLRPRLPPALRRGAHQLGCRHRFWTQELHRSDVEVLMILAFTWLGFMLRDNLLMSSVFHYPSFVTELECGHHKTTHCNKCPYDTNGTFMGEKYCHGDCKWVGGKLCLQI